MVDATTDVATQQGPARVHLTPAKGEPRGSLLLTHGAGGGIGRAFALRFAREGAQVAVNDIKVEAAQAVPMTFDGRLPHNGEIVQG